MKYLFTLVLFVFINSGAIYAQQDPHKHNKRHIYNELNLSDAQKRAMKDTIAAYLGEEKIRKQELAKKLAGMMTIQQRIRFIRMTRSRQPARWHR